MDQRERGRGKARLVLVLGRKSATPRRELASMSRPTKGFPEAERAELVLASKLHNTVFTSCGRTYDVNLSFLGLA